MADGVTFWDAGSRRQIRLVMSGPRSGWLAYQQPDGTWAYLREATPEDLVSHGVKPAAVEASS